MTDDLKARALRAIEESEAYWSYNGCPSCASELGCNTNCAFCCDFTNAATLRGLLSEALEEIERLHGGCQLAADALVSGAKHTSAEMDEMRDGFRRWKDRCIEARAERDDLRRQLIALRENLEEARSDRDNWNLAALREENRAVKAEADNAALVEAVQVARPIFAAANLAMGVSRMDEILSQPHPGTRMLEELAALRRVEEASRALVERLPNSALVLMWIKETVDVLETIDTIRNRDNSEKEG